MKQKLDEFIERKKAELYSIETAGDLIDKLLRTRSNGFNDCANLLVPMLEEAMEALENLSKREYPLARQTLESINKQLEQNNGKDV